MTDPFQGDVLSRVKWIKQANRPWWPGVVFESWKSMRQCLNPNYSDYKRWSIQVHVNSRKHQFDASSAPGTKAVIYFTGEGNTPVFGTLADNENKRTVDYVDGFDDHYTDGRSKMNEASREKLEHAVQFADKVLSGVANEPDLFSPDTTFMGGSPMTAKSTTSRSCFGSSAANNVSASTANSTSSSKKNLNASFEVGNSLKSPPIKSVLKSGKKKKSSSSSDSNDRRSSWASPLAANVSIGSSVRAESRQGISSTPGSSGWSKPESVKERKTKLKRLCEEKGFTRILTRLIEIGWTTDMVKNQLYYFAPGYNLDTKGEQGKDWFISGNDKSRNDMLSCVARSKRWFRAVDAKGDDEEADDVNE
eukprot:CAMPEP_0118642270 /NCGR_PEP_ID=MMETSP0785-20121206/5748_1 /TAXON_ID=91992 /ORGANISM="Bolidomonas pacifica, Strain CCMP 1866" /LENGTH=362 /DNA_ID=CAMNT_0006533815 /DNA_START=127 /DNA_END=1212 /DNA_ORIENTATION=+